MKVRKFINVQQIIFLGPVNIYLTFWTLFPLLYMVYLSLTNWKIPFPRKFIWEENYVEALSDPLFRYSFAATFGYALAVSFIELLLGFGVALLLTQRSLLSTIARPLLIVPMVLTPIVTAMMWRFLFNPNFGPLNYMVGLVGLGPYDWLGSTESVWASLILVDVWQWMPFPALLILSGMHSLPEDIFEAAHVDGARGWQRLFFITVPMLRPLLLAAFVLRFLDALKTFDAIFVLTRGGPGTTTELLSFHIYRLGLGQFFRIGYGASMSILVLLAALVMSLLFAALVKQEELQSG